MPSKGQRQEAVNVKAFTPEQLRALLDATTRIAPAYAPLFQTLAGTGMRLGEALGLQWCDMYDAALKIHVQRAISQHDGRIETPKSGHGR